MSRLDTLLRAYNIDVYEENEVGEYVYALCGFSFITRNAGEYEDMEKRMKVICSSPDIPDCTACLGTIAQEHIFNILVQSIAE